VGALARTPGLHFEARSRWHETRPVGGPRGQPQYLNGVARFACELEPHALLARVQELEREAGRERRQRNAARTLDLDLLLMGELCVADEELQIPHPRLEHRLFVLVPLAELAPELVLPRCKLTVAERVRELLASGLTL
jgi:2-amino-4-hydroxy-6-hydroxymethyldihydropteridine diphosphokinase